MEISSTGSTAIERSLGLVLDVLDHPQIPLSRLAAQAGIPTATAHRMVGAFLRQGMLSRTGRGRYAPGLRLAEISTGADTRAVLAGASRPILRQLAGTLGTTVHLGVLEGDMVTYLVKECCGGSPMRTREALQLEAYCSAIGKVLLAALSGPERTLYLAAGPFVRLTQATITEPDALEAHLSGIASAGYAADRAEFEDGLHCLAVPIRGPGSRVVGAISASSFTECCDDAAWLHHLLHAAGRIGQRLGAPPWRPPANPAKVQAPHPRPEPTEPP